MGWLDLLTVQGTLKSLLQHHSTKASILWHSAFFILELSHPYMITGKTIALTTRTFFDKGMSLLFSKKIFQCKFIYFNWRLISLQYCTGFAIHQHESSQVITFLPRSKRLLIPWLQSPSVVILEPPQIKSVTVSTVSPSICHEVMGSDAMILVF